MMTEPIYVYDEDSDTLSITFVPGEQATGVELTEHILMRINTHERRAVGITLFDYSLLTQQTTLGPRSFPLVGFDQLPPDMREMVLAIVQQPPVQDILTLSVYTPNLAEATPIIAVQPLTLAASAPSM